MEKPTQTIACPICRKANPEIEAINRQINQARTPSQKAPFAKQLVAKVEEVLQEHGPAEDPIAEGCRTVLNLRKQTAELILKAQKLM